MGSVVLERRTRETEGKIDFDPWGQGRIQVSTGIGFLDHMIYALAYHARFNLELRLQGDLEVDDHHTVEDSAILLGSALQEAWSTSPEICRFGDAHAPLDEALARCVVDFSGRPGGWITLGLRRETLGSCASENLEHFLLSLAINSRITLHVDVLRGDNDHHRAEAAFKATALAFKSALAPSDTLLSTKGVLG